MRLAWASTALVLAVAPSAPSDAAGPRRQPCAPAGARVLARGKATIVFEPAHDDVVAACSRGKNLPPLALASQPLNGAEIARVRGRYAAVAISENDKETGDCVSSDLAVWDMSRRRRITARSYSDAGDDVCGDVRDVELGSDGALVALLTIGANSEVWLLCPHNATREAAERDLGPTLIRRANTVWWTSSSSGRRVAGIPATCRR